MIRLRQLALVARDLTAKVQDLRSVLDLGEGYRDPGVGVFGLENRVLAVGDTFLEVVSPRQEGTTAGRLLDKRGGDGGYMVIVQVDDDLPAHRSRMADLGVRIVWETELDDMATLHLHPRDVGGAILSLDVARPADSWRWAGPGWQRAARSTRVTAIVGAELQGPDSERMAMRWAAVLGRAAARRTADAWIVDLDGGTLRFVEATEGSGEGLVGLTLAAEDRAGVLRAAEERGLDVTDGSLNVCGVTLRLV